MTGWTTYKNTYKHLQNDTWKSQFMELSETEEMVDETI